MRFLGKSSGLWASPTLPRSWLRTVVFYWLLMSSRKVMSCTDSFKLLWLLCVPLTKGCEAHFLPALALCPWFLLAKMTWLLSVTWVPEPNPRTWNPIFEALPFFFLFQVVKACNEGVRKMSRTEQMISIQKKLEFKIKVGVLAGESWGEGADNICYSKNHGIIVKQFSPNLPY